MLIHSVAWALGVLIAAILAVMLINETVTDATSAKVLRLVVIGAALVFALFTLAG